MRRSVVLFICFLLLPVGMLHAKSFDPSKLQGLGDTRYHLFESERLGHTLHIYVRIPGGESQNPGKQFPTIYLLDGGINYPLHRNLDFFMGWKGGEEMPLDATRFFVSEGEFNDPRFKTPAMEWIDYWSDPERDKPFVLEVQVLSGQSHLSSVTESFRRGLTWLFSTEELAER